MTTTCPKCGHQRTGAEDPNIPDTQCPACGIFYFKYINQQADATQKRISLSAAQLKTEAGAQLLRLCQEVTDDGQLSEGEIEEIRGWLARHVAVDLPAIEHMNKAIADYFNPDSSLFCYKKPLYKAIEAVLPVNERKQAAGNRKIIESGEKLRLREENKQKKELKKQKKKADRERNRPIFNTNFMVAGCKYENRPQLIDRYVNVDDPVILQRDKNNRFSRFAVKVLTQSGQCIGFVPEIHAKEVAKALDANTKYDAVFTKVLGYNFPIPVVDVDFFRADADQGQTPQTIPVSGWPTERLHDQAQSLKTNPVNDSHRLLAHAETDKYKTNHILHLLLSIISGGLWLIIWFIVSANNVDERNRIFKKYGVPEESNPGAIAIKALLAIFLIGVFVNSCSQP